MPKKAKKNSLVHLKGKKGGEASLQQGAINPLLGAAVGATVGGVMGAAAAVVLSDRETRERLKTAASNLRDQAMERVENLKDKNHSSMSANNKKKSEE